jgi:type II secretory pathway component GspD/PulD (secretin)
MRRLSTLIALALVAATLAGCAAAAAYRKGFEAGQRRDWDAAVSHYRQAVQEDPDRPEYRIALERAMIEAALQHAAAGKAFEEKGELDAALREFRRASEYEPSNRQLAARVASLDQTIRDRIEAARPRSKMEDMRERARRSAAEPMLNPASRDPLIVNFPSASVRDILRFIGQSSGINVTFTGDYRDPPAYTVHLEGVTLEQALQQVLSANSLFYKVLNDRTILVIPDSVQNRAKYEEQVIRTFYLSHADPQEIVQTLNVIGRVQGSPIVPAFSANKTQNSVTVRGTAALVAIMERIIEANDRPRAEIIVDVQILEVNRGRAKQFGLELSNYSVTGIFSPEVRPQTGDDGVTVPPFNLNTVSTGISSADFYMTVPTAVVRFLESDNQTKLVAKPQLRGREGEEIKLNLGDRFPVPSTTFGSLGGAGSVATQPISSFNYEPVGIIVNMTPRVTFEGDVVMKLVVESSTLGQDVNIAGQNLPSFGSRKVETTIRLRDGESTLLAGLLREDERRRYTGFPGLMHLPVFRQLFTSNDISKGQTDIVILLTPRIIRTHELTQRDVDPLYIGSQQNLGIGGPPPLIAAPPASEPPATPPAGVPPDPGTAVQPPPMPGTLARPGIMPEPATPATPVPAPTQPQTPELLQPPPAPTPPAAPPAPETPPQAPTTAQAQTTAMRVLVTPPGPEMRLGGGPYTVPVSVGNAPRVSTLSLTITFNPAIVRVRAVQEGSFMRQGGVSASFSQQVDPVAGRVDITVVRGQDIVGATGTGLVAALVVEPVAAGNTSFGVAGTAAGPGGAPVSVTATPAAVSVK